MEKRILFAGNPDQGILYAGQTLIEALVEAGWRAACVDALQQGNLSHCTILIGDEPLGRSATMPEIGLLASLPAANAFERAIRPGGLLVLNGSAIRRPVLRRDVDVIMVPVEEDAEDPTLATLTLLGALVALTGWAPVERVLSVVNKSCVGNTACRAFRQGVEFVEEMLESAAPEAA